MRHKAGYVLRHYAWSHKPEIAVVAARYEFEDKKEYLNALHAQQRDQQASTQFTTNVSKVRPKP